MADDAFPDVRWGHQTPILKKYVPAFAGTHVGSWMIRTLTPLDRKILARTKGRRTILGPIGLQIVLLTTTGRKSGQPRSSPLLYVRDGDRLVVVGSNFGQAHHPAWTGNLLANPNAHVTMGGADIDVVATPIVGAEKDQLYRDFVEMAGNYETYLDRTDRDLRMFALTRR